MVMMTTEHVPIALNNSFGDKWKIEIGKMEKRKQTGAFFNYPCDRFHNHRD
jgi:hypothetical protein